MIDNFDSFTYNLVQYLMQLGQDVEVHRNNALTMDKIETMNPSHIVISPGPGTPKEAGISMEVIRLFKGKIPILGVCLGHQCMGEVFGGKVLNAQRIMHGKISTITHNGKGIFKDIPNPFKATRYHSLAIERDSCPKELIVTARSEDDEIMAVEHETLPVYGVQFHPESILTEYGLHLLNNFLKLKSHS